MGHLVAPGIHVDETGEGRGGGLKEAIPEHVRVELLALCEFLLMGA